MTETDSSFLKLLKRFENDLYDSNQDVSAFLNLQKLVLKEAAQILANGPSPEADYAIGVIGVTNGDQFRIPPENALAHLNRAYVGGYTEAGFYLAFAYKGVYDVIPVEMQSYNKTLLLFEDIAKTGHPHALYELSNLYLHRVTQALEAGDSDIPLEWFHHTYEYATKCVESGYSGGYVMMGFLHRDGFGDLVARDPAQAYICFAKGIDSATSYIQEKFIVAFAKWVMGCMKFYAEGVARDRKTGVSLIFEAAEMGEQQATQWLIDNEDFLDKSGLLDDPCPDDFVYEGGLIEAQLYADLPDVQAPDTLPEVHTKGDELHPMETFKDAKPLKWTSDIDPSMIGKKTKH